MEFWGAEVKRGHNFEIELKNDGGRILHLSQVALGEVTGDSKKEKGKETVCVYLKFKNEKFVIGTLSQEKFPHVALDLVVHEKFELSHNWKNDSESEEEIPELVMNPIKSQATTSDPTTSKQVKIVEPKKDEDSSDGDDDDDSSVEDEESGEDQEPSTLVNGENESDDDDDDDDDDVDRDDDDDSEESSDEDQETPEKAEPSNKRSAESATKTPAPKKKAKLVTPEKTVHSGAEGKKVSGHTATPHPSKKSGKASAAAATQPKQTPNSSGSFPCKSCGRSFGSENALQSHSKAKHSTPA